MRKMIVQITCSFLSLTLVASDLARAVQAQVRLDQEMRFRQGGTLATETVLPKGTIIQVNVADFHRPQKLRVWENDQPSQAEFIKGVKVISAPGFSNDDINGLNDIGGDQGLFVRKSLIGGAKVVAEIPQAGDQGAQLRMETQVTMPVEREHTAPTDDPADDGSASDLAREALEKVNQGNASVRDQTAGDRPCDSTSHYQKFRASGVSPRALDNALAMYKKNPGGKIKNRRYMMISDFTKNSNVPRLFIFDMETGAVAKFHTSHGSGNPMKKGYVKQDKQKPSKFSNKDGSFLTPPGFHVTSDSYHNHSRHGRSLRLKGLEERNSESYSRYILIHGAPYATPAWVRDNGYTGRSWGCLTIPPTTVERLLPKIRGGSLVYNYTGND